MFGRTNRRSYFRSRLFCGVIIAIILVGAHVAQAGRPPYLHEHEIPYLPDDRYCAAYVTWHALNYFNQPRPIEDIVRRFQQDTAEGVSMSDLVAVIRDIGLDARPVRTNASELQAEGHPFILYLPPPPTRNLVGHLVFCLPEGNEQLVILDGAKEPRRLSFSELRDKLKGVKWSGEAIIVCHQPFVSAVFVPVAAIGVCCAAISLFVYYGLRKAKKLCPETDVP